MSIPVKELFKLSIPERIELAEALWDSIVNENAEIPFTEKQISELEERFNLYQKGQMPTYSWEDARQMILKNEF